ncbi:MAG TPA: hypothetical protein VJX30_20165 [Terriglobales bacterium]|jgi:hypothetical protein|nr:hypothetical protein [Terriglobales bacterium]
MVDAMYEGISGTDEKQAWGTAYLRSFPRQGYSACASNSSASTSDDPNLAR